MENSDPQAGRFAMGQHTTIVKLSKPTSFVEVSCF
jgi:hypothetical protein